MQVVDLSESKQESLKTRRQSAITESKDVAHTLKTFEQERLKNLEALQTVENDLIYKQQSVEKIKKEQGGKIEEHMSQEKELNDLKEKRKQLTTDRQNLSTRFEELQNSISEYEELRGEAARKREQIRIDFASSKARIDSAQTAFQANQNQFEFLKKNQAKRLEELATCQANEEQCKTTYSLTKDEISELILTREKTGKVLGIKKGEHSETTTKLKALEKKLKEERLKLEKCRTALNEHNIEREKVQSLKQTLKDNAQERLKLDLDSLTIEKLDRFNEKSWAQSISNLKSKIEGLGAINMVAVEEYQELEKRSQFIEGQKEEIQASIDELQKGIDEIEAKSREKYLATFDQLNQQFQELFPILFPRGEGKITITDIEDPLESGVEIIVRLPGKNQQNMRLFSGGEKALTAIAFVFALLKSKPTPFCFLDEVDAALDEANVAKYNKILEALADRFQFILITHRRRTIEVLDTLYGVTMQEPGVSKVVGVDLNKELPLHLQKAFSNSQTPPKDKH